MAKFNVYINDNHVRIVSAAIGEKYQSMADGAVITDPTVVFSEISRISKECDKSHELAEFFTVSEHDPDHEWMFYDAGENGWVKFFFENVSGEWRQIGAPDFWATLKDLLWYIDIIGDYDYQRIIC